MNEECLNLLARIKGGKGKINFVDVGAFKGDFTDAVLRFYPGAEGILFEPTVSSYDYLKEKYKNSQKIHVQNIAADIEQGTRNFYCAEDSAQNSLLNFVNSGMAVNVVPTIVDSIDNVVINMKIPDGVDIIKIDSQGNDVNILKGGLKIIKKSRPVIISEFIFVPLYNGQCSYYEQISLMKELDYELGGIYDQHYSENGILAFADLLFVPGEKHSELCDGISQYSAFVSADAAALKEENKRLYEICEERLNLINELTAEAQKRLDLINTLNSEINRFRNNN